MPNSGFDHFVTINGFQFHYVDWGGDWQAIILLHGLASNSRIWDLVAPILSSEYKVYAVDQRGHGDTDKPSSGYDFDTIANDLSLFITTLGIKTPIIVGHSWGGDVAVEFAVINPDQTKGLCLIDGGTIEISARVGWDLARAKNEMAPPVFTGVTFEALLNRSATHWGLSRSKAETNRFLLGNFQVVGDGTVAPKFNRANHLRVIEALWDHRPSQLYSQVLCPVLLMPARQAVEGSDLAGQLRKELAISQAASLLPNNKTVWLEDSVHDVPVQRPELVASVISENINRGLFDSSHE